MPKLFKSTFVSEYDLQEPWRSKPFSGNIYKYGKVTEMSYYIWQKSLPQKTNCNKYLLFRVNWYLNIYTVLGLYQTISIILSLKVDIWIELMLRNNVLGL